MKIAIIVNYMATRNHSKQCNNSNKYQTFYKRLMKFVHFSFSPLTMKIVQIMQKRYSSEIKIQKLFSLTIQVPFHEDAY